MDELGDILREAREARGLTLAQVQGKIRISTKFLDALENGQYETLPTAVHVRGFLRNYARFLELDPKPLLERYESGQNRRPVRATLNGSAYLQNTAPIPSLDEHPFFVPVNVELGGNRNDSDSTMRLVIIAALLIALALVANRFIPLLIGNGDGTSALTQGLNEAVSGIINNGDNQETAIEVTDETPLSTGELIIPTGVNNTLALPTATPTRPALPVTLESIELTLEITERVWMEVTIDGSVVYEGQATRGDGPFEWVAQQEARFTTGNGAGVFVTINGTELGKLGGRGQIVNEVWTTTGN